MHTVFSIHAYVIDKCEKIIKALVFNMYIKIIHLTLL